MKQDELTANVASSVLMSLTEADKGLPNSGILGVIKYTTECVDPDLTDGHPELSIHMTDNADDGFAEIWTTDQPVEAGHYNALSYAHDGEYLLCAGRIAPTTNYTEATSAAYISALELMDRLDYKSCFRMWNFVNHINGHNAQGLETYRDFCRGRAKAFEQFRFGETELPAATGVGSLGGGIAFYLLACRSGDLTPIENSKQIAAYRYPKKYGPKSPAFARATHLTSTQFDGGLGQIYLSGTASIRGHETLFRGDIEKQCQLALDNIAHVISAENLSVHEIGQCHDLSDLRNIKVYVRHSADIPRVREICYAAFSPTADIAYFNVDICRSDLLVEIEGIVA